MNLEHSGKGNHPLFTKELVTEDLKTSKLSIRDYCIQFGGEAGWRKYYNQIWLWRKTDPELNQIIQKSVMSRKINISPGRTKKEVDHPTWKQDYCTALLEHNGNREKAAQSTPYSLASILEKCDKKRTAYDEEFAEMVRATELKISARAEEMLNSAILEFENKAINMDRAKVLDIQARIAEKIVSKMDYERWGKRLEINVEGEVKHKLIPQGDRIARLIEERREILASKGQDLPMALPESTEHPVIDVEVLAVEEVE